ncbi:hypothetical protein [Streptomyces sp. NPDC047725]|uniref:hypothetical protein n=1 Tax=Streptomyces sp. NPDC047725 TaxID=3365487 RepID=UPI0037131FBF
MAAERHPGGPDPLMAAITDEPLPPGADPDARDAYRSARADVALLREQLGILGHALGEPPRAPETAARPAPAARPRRRPIRLALGTLAAACAGAVVAGLGWLAVGGAGGTTADSAASGADRRDVAAGQKDGSAFGTPRYLACARLVAEGTVTGAEPVPGAGWHRITLRVTHAYTPGGDTGQRTFLLDDAVARLNPGDQVLVGVPRGGAAPDTVITGARDIAGARAAVTASLPEARTLTCD